MRQAINGRWPVTESHKKKIVEAAIKVVEDEESDSRAVSAAMKVILAAEAQNQKDEHRTDNSGGNRFLAIAQRLGIRAVIEGTATEVPVHRDKRIGEPSGEEQE